MSKEIYISSTPHETRLAIVEHDALTEIYYERENEYTLAGSIYNGKVTRVLPGMQSSFVDIGLERDAFLYITDFMEEAGDSADFEASANSGDHARAPRSEGRTEGRSEGRGNRDRGDRGDRGERTPRELPARTAEPTDADLFTEAVSGLDPARPVTEGERGERGGRRGGRNRRDRNSNSDGTPRRDRGEATRPEPVRAEAPQVIIPTPDSHDEVGEGAPGADGSRRWRGRRGRRGNRGREEAAQPVAPVEVRRPDTGPVADAYGAVDPLPETTFVDSTFDLPVEAQQPRPERNERGTRRGGRDRNRGDREARPQQPPRVPRGFAPSASLYKVEGGAEELAPVYGAEEVLEAPAEPIILPGESLSKYRPGSSSADTPAQTEAFTPPVSEFVAQGWDGGMVLPGETIRPRGPIANSGRSEPARGGSESLRDGSESLRGGPGRDVRGGREERDGRDDRGGRKGRGDRNDRGPRPDRTPQAFIAPVEAPVVDSQEEPTYLSAPETVPASHLVTPIHSTFIAPPPMPEPEAVAASEPDFTETQHEFEPSDASASYRVDPVPPSEFRQAAPPLDGKLDAELDRHMAPDDHIVEQPLYSDEPIRPEDLAPAEVAEFAAEPTELPPAPEHQMTTLSDTGNLHSDVAETVELPPIEEPEPTAPIVHEAAVVTEAAPFFAPGTGYLEEEMMDDEEEEQAKSIATLHAFHDEEHDHPEQETFEGAADLGTMLREMSIDQITRTPPALDEDEDDDFLEEDQDYDSSDSSEPSDEEDAEERENFDEESGEDRAEINPDERENSEYGSGFEGERPAAEASSREPRRERPREDRGRRDGRRGDRNRRSAGNDRPAATPERSSASSDRPSGDRERGRRDGRGGRPSMQMTNLPAISDLLKPGQEILCQIAKEPIAKKGARITSHIALPGRFLVFMPTVSHTGVSRKIESDGERRRLKEILLSEKGEASGGFIVRTAAAGASEEELRSDLRFLLNLWSDIKARSESSKSPALIYHDLNLVERVLRDQVTDTFSAIWVDTETEYERVLRFLQRFQPSLIRRVKLYTKETPLFEQFGITEEINKALRSKVWLKSGGSIVINQTEALVAIDINTGKFVGKTARLEDTIVKTNLDAIPEIVRQIRLRDLGGIIIIDFIDMDERKNRNKVMAALEEELKSDRAPSKMLPFNDFGLIAITRKRVKQSLERTLSTTCGVCAGTGMVKSPVTVCNDIYIEMRKMHKHLDRGDVMLRVNPEVVKQLKSTTSRWLQEMEEMVGKTILVKSDPSLHPEQFDIH